METDRDEKITEEWQRERKMGNLPEWKGEKRMIKFYKSEKELEVGKVGGKFGNLTVEKIFGESAWFTKGRWMWSARDSYGELSGIKYKIGMERKKITILKNHRCKWKEEVRIWEKRNHWQMSEWGTGDGKDIQSIDSDFRLKIQGSGPCPESKWKI